MIEMTQEEIQEWINGSGPDVVIIKDGKAWRKE